MSDYINTNSSTQSPGVTLRREHLVALFAVGLIISFFLPWIHVLFARPSGFNFASEGDKALLLWSLPVMAFIALVAALSKHAASQVLTVLAGLMPFVILGYVLLQGENPKDLFKAIDTGGWIGFGSGLALIALGAAQPHTPGPMFMKFTDAGTRLIWRAFAVNVVSICAGQTTSECRVPSPCWNCPGRGRESANRLQLKS